MRRRRKNKSINFMTAVVVEVGAMLGIVAVAQPTWTRGLIEQVAAPAVAAVAQSATGSAVAAGQSSPDEVRWDNPALRMAADPAVTALSDRGWNQAASHTARLATPPSSFGWMESDNRWIAPVLPPPVASLSTPPWGSGNGWIEVVPNR